MSFNLAGNGVTGSINEFVLDLVDSNDIQDTGVPTESFDATLNGILEVDDNDPSFSISGQINQVSANMDFTSNESGHTEITRDEDFVIDSFTESFSSEAGNYNGL
jgi:3,4-dihydroxy-2-butanone 4-phosphate synthase